MDDQTFDKKTAEEWISTIESAQPGLRAADIYPRLNAWADQSNPSDLLEIGCGQGICSDHIDLRNRNYVGLEPSPFLVDRARTLYSSDSRSFVTGDLYKLPFSAESFDGVFSVAVWHLLSDLDRAATELARVLRKDAQFLIITANPNAYSLWTDQYTEKRLDGVRFEGVPCFNGIQMSKDVLYLHSLDDILNSLLNAGLQVTKTETFRRTEKSKAQDFFLSIQGQLVNQKKKWIQGE